MPSSEDWEGDPDPPEDEDEEDETEEPAALSSDSLRAVRALEPRARVIPIFPLADTVLFPNISLPIHISEERHKAMVTDLLAQDSALAVSLLESEDAGPREVCAVGIITHVEELEDGEKNIVVTGSHRARIEEVMENRPYPMVRIVPLEPPLSKASVAEIAALVRQIAIEWVFFQDGQGTQQLIQRIVLVKQPGYLADFLAHHLFEDAALKQEILETVDEARRLVRVQSVISAALERAKSEKGSS
jgi:Lon protease-like protein